METCWHDSLSGVVCQSHCQLGELRSSGSSESELCCVSVLRVLCLMVQTLSPGGKTILHRSKWPLTVPCHSMGSAVQHHWHCRAPHLLLGRRRGTPVTAHRNGLMLVEKAKHNFLLLGTGKESPICWPPYTASGAAFSPKSRTTLLSGVSCQMSTLDLTGWSKVGCARYFC